MEMASTYAKSLIETLLNVHALAYMHRASDNDEYRQAAAKWLPSLDSQLAGLRRELGAPSADPRPAAQPGVVKEAVRRELADVEASLDDAISYLVDLAGAKPTPMSPQNCRIHIDHARMSARNLAALAAPVSQEPVADKWGGQANG